MDADPDLALLLVGPRSIADEVVAKLSDRAEGRVDTETVDRGVAMADPVSSGADPTTSIGAAMAATAAGRADAVVSAGSSGAIVAASVMALGRLPGVRRPALAAVLPGATGPVVLLDVGAGMEVTAVDLVRYAWLGAGYARLAGVGTPRVGLLSVGAEPGKGDRLRRDADVALRGHPLPDAEYVGPVEGNDVVSGARADVIVSDGFTGNVVLKAIEAARLAASPGPAVLPRAAVLLGVGGTVVVCHGAATGPDVASGLALAARLARDQLVRRLPRASGLASSVGSGASNGDGEADAMTVASRERVTR
jgi:glycerol-3-phosphate acyltransferase PlsX